MRFLGFVCLFCFCFQAVIAQPLSFNRKANNWLDDYINPQLAPFYHGVASGDPLNNAVIIWTRVTQPDSLSSLSINVDWEFASDINFNNVVQSGIITTDAEKDFTVKIDVQNLNSDTYYYYRFKAFNTYSIVGRTKTTPIVNIDKLRIAAISCSNYQEGYFSAYKVLADRSDLDAILHLGDYIYENEFDNKSREHQPRFEAYDLLHYRQRYSQYRLDKDLMRCHQVHPMIIIWDDHDIVVDALRDTSFRHNPSYGLYSERKFGAIKAAREWLPIRDIDNNFFKNWRKLNFGNLADVMMIDARLYDRDNWPADINDTLYGSANAKFLGPEQLNWLNNEIKNSNATWKIIGNGLMIAQLNSFGPNPAVMENWDGYPYERNLFYDNLINNNIDNVVFVTGDFHCSFSCNLTKDPKDTVAFNAATGDGSLAVEFIVPSISGSNYDEDGADSLFAIAAADLIKAVNQHIKFAELTGHGYVLLDIDSNRTQAEFWHMKDIKVANNYKEQLVSIWQTENGENKLKTGTMFSVPKTNFGVVPDEPPFNYSGFKKDSKPTLLTVTPNPFNAFIFCNYVLNEKTNITITLTDINNRVVENVNTGTQEKGNYFISVNTQQLSSGIYFINFQYNGEVLSKKIVKN
jgi:alkaline phosphatase D